MLESILLLLLVALEVWLVLIEREALRYQRTYYQERARWYAGRDTRRERKRAGTAAMPSTAGFPPEERVIDGKLVWAGIQWKEGGEWPPVQSTRPDLCQQDVPAGDAPAISAWESEGGSRSDG